MTSFESLLGRTGLLPHGYCFQWAPEVLWPMVGADLAIAAAYFSIPLAIFHFVRRRPQLQLGRLPWLFAAFILLCGFTHLSAVWVVWRPDYELHAAVKVATAAVSLGTAALLWRLMPALLRIPSVGELQQTLDKLTEEVDRRQLAESSRDQLEQALATALAASGAGFVATDALGRVSRINAVGEAITGWSARDALGTSVWDVIRREDRPQAMTKRNPVDVLVESGPRHAQRFVCLARDGARKPVELSAELALGDDGAVAGMSLVMRDMSRLSEAEQEVRQLAAVVASMSDAVITKSLDGRITSWNISAERLLGWAAEDMLGEPVMRIVPPDLLAEEQALLEELGRGEPRAPFETWRLHRDGRRVPVSVAVSPVRDELGQVIGMASVSRDLTGQRRVEHRLQAATQAAQLGTWRFVASAGRFEGSARMAGLMGLAVSDQGWPLHDWQAKLHEQDRSGFIEALEDAMRRRADFRQDLRVRRPDGGWRWIRFQGGWHDDGEATLSGVCTDITVEQEAQVAREEAARLGDENRRIAEASRLKSLFLANMSHELRTPLNAVIGFADLLRSGVVADGSPKRDEYLGHIARSGRHLLQLINDVLDLSKVEAGRMEFRPQDLELGPFANALGDEIEPLLRDKSHTFRVEVDPSLGPVHLDPDRLRQVAMNYLSNAIKFTPAGGAVVLRIRAEGEAHFRLEVEDNGPGIALEDQPRLFVEFQQLDDGLAKRHQGTGLGLALTRHLVTAQGGRVGVRSHPGEGSLFFAVLPLAMPVPPASGARVLLAHAPTDLRDRLVRALGDHGVVVDTATRVDDLLALARRHRYDAWALDLLLHDGPTLQALERLRDEGMSLDVPVRLLSRSDDAGGVMFGIADLLAKPLVPEQLSRMLARLDKPIDGPILVVDDDPAARALMQTTLESLGHRVISAAGGAEALAGLDEVRPAAMILDLMMPGLDGFEVLQALRTHPMWSRLPVFVWTATRLDDRDLERLANSSRRLGPRRPADDLEQALASILQAATAERRS
ncbi:MAG: PAS domain S-box protein [Rhodoferax sp.]|nr:PAS domain S-box protein [Rhodoferax sp.]